MNTLNPQDQTVNIKNATIKTVKGKYTDLQRKIDQNTNGTLDLEYNFTYDKFIDETNFPDGVIINKTITINGNGYAISGNNAYRIFNVTGNLTLKNIILTNANASNGSAVYVSKYAKLIGDDVST